jgi:Tol biopolymer transport system component
VEETTTNKHFLDIIIAANSNSKRGKGVLSHIPIRFAFLFATPAILLLSSLLAIQSNQSAWAGTFPGPNEQIAFVRGPPEDTPLYEIYVMNADGSHVTRLTDNTASDGDPSWSPDGTKIAFDSNRDEEGNRDIYVMNADGSHVARLTDNTAFDGDPSWSPDGTKIAFTSDRDDNVEIYVMNADGSGQTRLTDNTAFDIEPSWSPDGEKIAFDSSREDDNFDIYVMNADGSDQTNLSNNDAIDLHPSWSPDGTKIAFTSSRDSGNLGIYVMNADGSGQTRLTDNDADSTDPSWSPDGTKLAFVSNRDSPESDNNAIYVMNADDGSEVTRLTDNDAAYSVPDWGTNTSTPGGGHPSPSEQAIDDAISTIDNLDVVPQSLKTDIIALLEETSNIVNDDIQITIDKAMARFLVP